MIRKHAVVHGYVQGVGFRYYARAEASHLGLGGYALNLPNGDVEIEIEGTEASVRRMLTWLAHGSSSAIVRSLDVSDVPPTGDTEFVIAF